MGAEQGFIQHRLVPAIVYTIIYGISAFYSVLFLLRFIYRFIKDPSVHFWKVKHRELPPECLKDPKYGNHCYIQIKNVKLHYVEAGSKDKPLMLFLHGFPEFWYSWRHQIKEFSKDYWTVAIDMRGYGDSEKPPGNKYYKMKYLVEDIKNVIDALGKEKCILVAHDWGGMVAWYLLHTYPHYVENYIIINAPHPLSFRKQLLKHFSQFRKSWYIFFFQVPYLPELAMCLNDMATFKNMFKSEKTPNPVTEDDIEAYKFVYGKPGAFTCPINYYRANVMPDWQLLKNRLDDNKPPRGLFLFGENDIAFDGGVVEKTKRIVHNLVVDIIPGANHFVQQDDADYVNKAISNFLKSAD